MTDGIGQSADEMYKSEDVLRDLYFNQELSTYEIAEELDCAQSTVRYWMDKLDIETRSISEAKWVASPNHRHWIRMWVDDTGHVKWRISVNGTDTSISVHRLIAVAEYGFDAIGGKYVHHKNEIPWDNRPENLELMEPGDHTTHHHQKITGIDRLRIVELYENGDISSRDLADMFDVRSGTIFNIRSDLQGGDEELVADGGTVNNGMERSREHVCMACGSPAQLVDDGKRAACPDCGNDWNVGPDSCERCNDDGWIWVVKTDAPCPDCTAYPEPGTRSVDTDTDRSEEATR